MDAPLHKTKELTPKIQQRIEGDIRHLLNTGTTNLKGGLSQQGLIAVP